MEYNFSNNTKHEWSISCYCVDDLKSLFHSTMKDAKKECQETCTYENQATVNKKKVNETLEKLTVSDTEFFKNLFETSYYYLCNSSSIENTSPEGLHLRKISRKDKLLLKNFLVTVLLYDMCYMSVWWERLRNINRSDKIQNAASQSTLDTSQPVIDPIQESNFFLLNSSSLKAMFSLTLLHRSKATKSIQKIMSSCFRLSSEIFLQFHTSYSRFPLRLKPSFTKTDLNSFRSFSIDPLKTRKHANFESISHENGTIALDRLQRRRSRTVEPTRNLLNKKRKNWTVLMNDIFNLVSNPSFRESFYSKISVLPSISDFDFTTQSYDESSLSIQFMNRLPSVLDTTVAFCIASICMFSLKALNTQELTRFSFRNNWMLTSHNTTLLEKLYTKNQSFSLNDYVLKLSKSHQKPDFSTMNLTKEETLMVKRLLNVIVFKKERSYALLSCKILIGHSPFVTLISGASGCGKSTLALHLGSKLGCIRVITTDTIRHICCSMGVKNTVSILKASTYDADVVLQKLNPLEQQFLEEHYGKPSYDAGPFSKCIEGYLMQSRLLYETINKVVESCLQEGTSIVLEGVHLTNEIVSTLQENFPERCFPFYIYLEDKENHLKRLASRSANCEMTPSKNKYVKCLKNIRAIQDFLSRTLPKNVVHIENTSIDCSVELIRQAIVSKLHENNIY